MTVTQEMCQLAKHLLHFLEQLDKLSPTSK